ncbi:MAG: hypothetical protein ACON4N_11240 [Myxococcota bacterium]
MKRILFPVLALLSAAIVMVTIAEMSVRYLAPQPPVQIVRERPHSVDPAMNNQLRPLRGSWVWSRAYDAPRHNASCRNDHPDAPVVLVLGSSIFAGVGLIPQVTFGVVMQEALSTDAPVCVINLAEPAFSFDSQRALLQEELSRGRVDVVLLEMWRNSAWYYTLLGDAAYRLRSLPVDEAGYPLGLLGGTLHHYLFEHSRFWELATLQFASRGSTLGASTVVSRSFAEERWRTFATSELKPALEEAEQQGAQVVIAYAPPLNAQFSTMSQQRQTLFSSSPAAEYASVVEVAAAEGWRQVFLEDLLIDQDVAQVRKDTCCHYNATGHQLLGERLAPLITEALIRGTGEPTATPDRLRDQRTAPAEVRAQ